MSLDDIKETFFAECADQMAELETGLHEIQSSGPDIDTVNAVFRAVHSIKGGAGAFGFAALVSFAHVFENALDVIRNDLNQVNEDRMDLLLRSVDVLSDVIEAERTGSEPDDTSGLANDLETAFGLAEAAEEADDGDDALADFAPVMIDLADLNSIAAGIDWWANLTGNGGEGMVVKPLDWIVRGKKGLVQPAVKCRGKEYLRIIYSPDYDSAENLPRLRNRSLGRKRSLALREFALGTEGLERFVRREPLRRVHECTFGVLALESEPVDPRL